MNDLLNDEKNLKKLSRLFAAMDEDSLTRSEFLKAFEQLMKFVVKVESDLIKKIDAGMGMKMANDNNSFAGLTSEVKQALAEIKSTNNSTFAKMKERAMEAMSTMFAKLDVQGKMDEMYSEHEAQMTAIKEKMDEMKMVEMPEPPTAEQTRDKLESLKNDERLDISAIKGVEELEKKIDTKISAIPRGTTARSSNSTKYHPLTPNGTTKTFTVPKNVACVVFGSDFPFVYTEGAGFTINANRTQIVLQQDNAPSAQSTLLFSYSSMFN